MIDIFIVTLGRFFAFPMIFLVLLFFTIDVVVVVVVIVVRPPLTLRDGPRGQKWGLVLPARFVRGVGLDRIQ